MADFSIDLAKLGEKDSTWTIGNFGKRDIERVSSHDDGPEDFTLRLGEWMRGTMPTKQQANPPSMSSDHALEIENLRNELQACRAELQQREVTFNEQLRAKDAIIDSLKEERIKAVTISSNELHQARDQLIETRRTLRDVEDEHDNLAQENQRQAETIENLQRALEEERLKIPDSVDAQLMDLQDEVTRMQNQKTTDTISYAEHRLALDKLQDDHAAATEALNAKSKKELNTLRASIIKAGEGMKKREERLTAAHEKEAREFKQQISSLQEELKNASTKKTRRQSVSYEKETITLKQQIGTLQRDLKSATAKTSAPTIPDDEPPTVIELRSAISALNNRLSSTNQALRTTSAEAEHYKKQAQEAYAKLKATIDENADLNREMDERMQKQIDDREREWRRRIKVMFKERETMANALMTLWGEKECGVAKPGEKQKYRYKYVDKDGKLLA